MVPRLTLLTFLLCLFLHECVLGKTITIPATDPRIRYWHRVIPDRASRALCRASPQFCLKVWWQEPDSDGYTTMGPDTSLTFSFTGSTRIRVLGSCDVSFCAGATLNGVKLPVNTAGGGTALLTADKLDPGASHTLVLAHAPLQVAAPVGFLSVSAIVLDSPMKEIHAPITPSPTSQPADSGFNSTSTGPASSSSGTSVISTRSGTTTTEHATPALVAPPNHSSATGNLEPQAPAFSQSAEDNSHASEPAPTSGEVSQVNTESKRKHKRTLIIVLCAFIGANVLLVAAFGLWKWRRNRAIAWEARLISAYTPHWHLPMQEPERDVVEIHADGAGSAVALLVPEPVQAQIKAEAGRNLGVPPPSPPYSAHSSYRSNASSTSKYGYI